ncbi:MAG: GTPase [Christensenellaceae bacterium]
MSRPWRERRQDVDTLFERDGKKYTLIDTAGIRKRMWTTAWSITVICAFDAVRRRRLSLVVDVRGLTEQDVKIIGYVHEQGKPSVILMNKWDLIEGYAYRK